MFFIALVQLQILGKRFRMAAMDGIDSTATVVLVKSHVALFERELDTLKALGRKT